MAGKIFINYRRDDSIGMAGRLHDRLAQTFGRDKLFMDVDHIPAGTDFVAHLNSQVAECDVVLVVIGPSWLGAKDESGERRLDHPDDFVAIEIAAALARGIRVIPVLVDGARMPKAGELPDSLKPLARRQAVDVRHSHFGHDAEALVARMREALGGDAAGRRRWRARAAIGAAAVAVLLLAGWAGYGVIQHLLTTVEQTIRQREAELKAELGQARAAAEAEEQRKADEAERQRLARAEQERQAKAAAEAEEKRKADEAERQRLARAEQERQARAVAEAEEKRKADEAERQRLARAEQERQARAAAAADEILWSTIKDSKVVAVFEEFLRKFPSSSRAPDASARRDALRQTQVAATTPSAQPPIPSQEAATPAPIGGIIQIGVAGPMSGPNSAFGTQMMKGVQQAVADINAAGGILGYKTSIIARDDASNPSTGSMVAGQFPNDGVQFVVGHFNSSVTLAASDVYRQSGIVAITPSSTNPRVTERGLWNIFRTCARDDYQGIVAGNYIASHFPNGRVAIVHDNTIYGRGLAEVTSRTINAKGMKEVLFQGISVGEKDFSALVSMIKTGGATLVYWGGLHTEGGLLVRQMRQQGVNATFMAGDGITTNEFVSIGGTDVEGTLMTFFPDSRKYPEARAVVEKFRAGGFEPDGYTLSSYAAVQIIGQAAEAAKSTDPRKVAEKMHSGMRFKTVIGDISYDEKGDITRLDYVMYVWRKGRDGKIAYFEK